ncbi:ABC transporter ATP-binding protein [Kroppenstedtia eburnea]|uniref:ATP-binding cassette, subfamily B, MsbA n=1 Tax=Kroppenstedtia eburnea TaxID=714067 RepID=A0A1N7PMH3_9BACL|nr:ABC transporter ATP-binding protein [Kroppenstedtia eburnea]QKI83226.1 ABC transporter ATP-binding protein [Kroppenstedtia eburnea]SIT11761.1 ATP-binding cassette, subfamily B, MsbA [Kroppenstedtia eburnea]
MGSVRRYLHFVRPYRKQIAATMVVGVLKFGIPLLLPLILKYVVDDILMTNAPVEEKLNHLFWILGGALFVFTVLRWPIEYYRQYFAQWAASRVLFDIRNRLFDHIQKLSLRYYNNRKVGQIISRVINDVEQTKEFVVTGMMNIWLDLITLSIAVGIMLWMDPWMTLVSLSVFPLYGVAVKYFYQGLRSLTRERSQALAEMQGHLHERIQGISVIRAFNLEKHEQGQFDKQNRHYLGKALAHSRWNAHTFAIVNTITDIAPILVIAFAGYQVIQGNLTIGGMTAFYGYLQLIYSPIRRLVNASTILTQALASMDRVFEFLDEPYDIQDSPHARSIAQARGEITFRDVHFSYRDSGEEVLKGIDLKIAPGQTIALVGMSGGGKSSLVSLIPRFYDIQQGSVEVDGLDVRDWELSGLRGRIGMVLQDNILFSGSVLENIRMGKTDASFEEVVAAAKAANAHDFITKLAEGYDTEIGERGVKLSGGQKQRLAIARVFLKDPAILILDEATSALDLESERLIQESLARLAKNRTTLIVAHRLSTITHADKICLMEEGRIVESGTHRELMARGGKYAHLFNVQHLDGSDVPVSRGTS